MSHPANSVFTAPPSDTGGAVNIRGIDFQNHVALKYCLEMLLGNDVTEVWCENQDDISIIHGLHPSPYIEIVQSKTTNENNWTVAVLCKREEKVKGTSILEKSLEYDKFSESIKFRMVTKKDVSNDLKILKLPLESADRAAGTTIEKIIKDAKTRLGDHNSPNGNDCDFWFRNLYWDSIGREDLLEDSNHKKLAEFAELHQYNLKTFELKSIYDSFYRVILNAGGADHRVDPEAKKLKKSVLESSLVVLIKRGKIPDDIFGDAAFRVTWTDFGTVLEALHSALDDGKLDDSTSQLLQPFDLNDKNAVNNMSPEFFDYLTSTYAIIFDDIRAFLLLPANKKYRTIYYDVAHEINAILHSLRGAFPNFEIIIQKAYARIRESMSNDSSVSRKTAWALIAYMYFNCDIGKRP